MEYIKQCGWQMENACDPPLLIMEGVKCNDGQNIAEAFSSDFDVQATKQC
jgi:hypothetical protein